METRRNIQETENSDGDKAERVKSPEELVKCLITHLTHKEYFKIVEVLTYEAHKYVNRLGLDDVELINDKLEDFKHKINEVAEGLDNQNHQQLSQKIKEIEDLVSELPNNNPQIFEAIKGFFSNVRENLEEYTTRTKQRGEKGSIEFSKLTKST